MPGPKVNFRCWCDLSGVVRVFSFRKWMFVRPVYLVNAPEARVLMQAVSQTAVHCIGAIYHLYESLR